MNTESLVVKQTVLHFRSSAVFAGPERYIQELEVPLRRQGFASAVMALYRRPPSGPATHPLVAQAWARGLPAWQITDSVQFSPGAIRAVAERLRSGQFSLLHTHDYKSNLIGWVAARQAGIPIVATVHLHTQTDFRLRLYRQLDLWVLRRFSHIIAVARTIAEDLVAHGIPADRITVIHTALDTTQFDLDALQAAGIQRRVELGLAPEQPVITFIGRLTAQKGLDYFLNMAAQVQQAVPQAWFLIIGDGVLRAQLQAQAQALGLGKAITFLGYREDIPVWMAASDVVVNPAVREGLPYVILEALAMARPVVATTVGGVPEVIVDGKSGRLVHPGDVQALTQAVLWVLRNPEAAREMAQNGRAWVIREANAETMAQYTAAVYRSVLPISLEA
jgi:glycosyltransferase involved in cell wall biosynthesis